jgi:hypothetical protein
MKKELMQEIMNYIEATEQTLEWEFGSCRELEEMIEQDSMPDVWKKLRGLLKERESDGI